MPANVDAEATGGDRHHTPIPNQGGAKTALLRQSLGIVFASSVQFVATFADHKPRDAKGEPCATKLTKTMHSLECLPGRSALCVSLDLSSSLRVLRAFVIVIGVRWC